MSGVWVLDMVGYDQRGGSAQLFVSAEAAKATVPHVRWKAVEDGWEQDGVDDWHDIYVLTFQEVRE